MTTAIILAVVVTLALLFTLALTKQSSRISRLDEEWQADAERRRLALSLWTADIEAREVAPEPPAVTQAKRELMERARIGQ